jgi:RNA polymerase sigma factor (sigma-70 family)
MILDRIRKQHKLSFIDNPGKQHADFFLASCEAQLIDKQVSEEKNSVLNKALEKLTCRQKEVIFLRFYEELSYQEIAFLMSFKSVKSVRNVIYAAINHIKKNVAVDPKLSLMECLNICLSLF